MKDNERLEPHIKHCPFCGGKAEIYFGSSTVQVQCTSCGARSRAFYPSAQSAHDKAIRSWNLNEYKYNTKEYQREWRKQNAQRFVEYRERYAVNYLIRKGYTVYKNNEEPTQENSERVPALAGNGGVNEGLALE